MVIGLIRLASLILLVIAILLAIDTNRKYRKLIDDLIYQNKVSLARIKVLEASCGILPSEEASYAFVHSPHQALLGQMGQTPNTAGHPSRIE